MCSKEQKEQEQKEEQYEQEEQREGSRRKSVIEEDMGELLANMCAARHSLMEAIDGIPVMKASGSERSPAYTCDTSGIPVCRKIGMAFLLDSRTFF